MKPSELHSALRSMIPTGRNAMIWGAPGVAKSSIVHDVAAELNRKIIDVRCVLLDPVDLRGIPHINGDNRAHWCPPSFLPHDPASDAIVFMDELPQAPALVQSACLQLTLDRKLGEYELPKGVAIVAAGNRQKDRSGSHRLISALANRFVHLDLEVDTADWLNWAAGADVDPRIRSFIRFKPEMLDRFDPAKNENAFPTPRSWEFASDVLKGLKRGDPLTRSLMAGCVGEGAAAELMGYLEIYVNAPSAAKILADPEHGEVPEEPSVLHAVVGQIVDLAKGDKKLLGPAATYAARLSSEFGTYLMVDLSKIDGDVCKTPEGKKFIAANKAVLLGSR